jgi:hypothetical protein
MHNPENTRHMLHASLRGGRIYSGQFTAYRNRHFAIRSARLAWALVANVISASSTFSYLSEHHHAAL